jgi:O-acetylserine/cysteine efflux transporter
LFFPVPRVTVERMPRRHALLASTVAAIWGVNFVVIHVGLEHFPPLLFAALRFVLVALALPFVPKPGVPVRYVIAVGLFMSAGQFGFLFLGIDKGMPAGLASLVIQLQVAFTVILAVVFLGERPKRVQLAGIGVAFAGIGIIAGGRAEAVPLLAVGLVVLSALSWGIGNVANRKAASPHPVGMLVWSSLVPPVPLLALSLTTESGIGTAFSTLDAAAVASLLFVVLISTFVGFGAWTALLARHQASQVVPFALLVPVFGIASAWVFLNEVPTAAEWAGAAVVLAGLGLTVKPPAASLRRLGTRRARTASLPAVDNAGTR